MTGSAAGSGGPASPGTTAGTTTAEAPCPAGSLVNEAVRAVGPARGRSAAVLQQVLEAELRARGAGLPSTHVHQLAEAVAEGRPIYYR